ncbi:MAG: hypothetical protein HRU38_00395 [Saccharospirillaceae bacterium]|nr:hypothetical protein [Saccharospirillaceae bacterium]
MFHKSLRVNSGVDDTFVQSTGAILLKNEDVPKSMMETKASKGGGAAEESSGAGSGSDSDTNSGGRKTTRDIHKTTRDIHKFGPK